MTKLFAPVICVLLLLTLCLSASAGLIMTETFESSTWNTNWTGASLPSRVAAPAAGHGSWSLVEDSWLERATRNNFAAIPANTSLTVRFWFYDTSGSKGNFVDLRNSGNSQIFALGNENGAANWEYRLAASSGTVGWITSSVARTYGSWKKFEMYYDGNNHATWLIDGGVAADRTNVTNTGVTFNNIVLGNGATSGNSEPPSYIDDIALIQSPKYVAINQSPTGGTVTGTVGGSTFSILSGYYADGETIAMSAISSAYYMFVKWTDSAGNTLSTSPIYTYTVNTSASQTVNAVFSMDGYTVTTTSCQPAGGTVSPDSQIRGQGDSVTVIASANPGYTFTGWTTSGCGGTPVSTSSAYTFVMPPNNVQMYAVFAPNNYNMTRTSCGDGTVSGASGMYATDTVVTVTATPAPGYWFDGWTSDDCGGTAVVSRDASYTFAMKPYNYDLHANFSRAEFVETYEGYNTGGTSFDSLDKNDPVGPNQAANGLGNPWWGPIAPNGRINTANSHSGLKSLWGTAGNCKDLCNVQFRHNGGNPFPGSIFLDWWFYDPFGPSGTTTNFCADYTALSYYTGIPADADYPTPVPNTITGNLQQLAVGMSDNLTGAYDPTKYQVRIAGDSGGYSSGWFNTNVTREAGWHHARVVVGPKKTPSNTNDVTFYIDDMQNAVMGPRDSVTTVGFNIIETNTIMPRAGSCSSANGCVYSRYFHYSGVDDICFGALATTPAVVASTALSPTQIRWSWTPASTDEDGFKLWDASAAGTAKGTAPAQSASMIESSLQPNTRYLRWIDSYVTRYCGDVDGPRAALPATYTLAKSPVYGESGDAAVSCSRGPGNSSIAYQIGDTVQFSAVNGFGTGPAKAGKYLYIWNSYPNDPTNWNSASQWTIGTLNMTPTSGGSYYLHLRACNGDGVANTTALTLGPYVFDSPIEVSRIGDAWAYDNGIRLQLSGQVVTLANGTNAFWIEEPDRSAAMRVEYSTIDSSWQGRAVTVTGYLDASTMPRKLIASVVTSLGTAPNRPAPLGVALRALGGGSFNAKTPGIANGKGLYNLGLLIKTAGKVTYCDNTTDPNNKYFYIDDGSALAANDSSGHSGVKVKCGSSNAPTSGMVKVIGIINTESSPNGYVPVLIVRNGTDIAPM